MATITSKSLPLQVAKELDQIYRVNLASAPTEFDKVTKVESAPDGPYLSQGEITGIGLPSEIEEGAGVNYDMPVEGNVIRRNYVQSGLGYIITDIMLKDELFGQMKKLPADLAKSMRIFSDIKALELYNDAENATTVSKDGVALANSAGHTLLNDVMGYGTYFNIPTTAAALSESSFRAALEYFDNVVDENGYPVKLELGQMIVSQADQYIAHRLRTQMYGGSGYDAGLGAVLTTSGSQENAHMLNLANPENGFVMPWTVFASRYLEDDRWILNAKDHDVKFLWKEKPKQTSEVDFDTDNIKFKAKQRLTVFCNEYRGSFFNIDGNDRT
jgi:hypothetical protein